VTPLTILLREEIARNGPISFHRFMEVALYHPKYGYYRRASRDPFGRHGDFFTAEQVQPVFGTLIAARIRSLYHDMGEPPEFTVVELGAGRGEMREALSGFRYVPVEVGSGKLPESFHGVVFANEFYDALPVYRVVWVNGEARESLVGWRDEHFVWVEGPPVTGAIREYIDRYLPEDPNRASAEVNLDALEWIERIARSLDAGYSFTIDYGYTKKEAIRFPAGTLMSYRRHTASSDVLSDPGERDITAHVNFTALEEHGKLHGLATVRFETLAKTLLEAGEADHFASALAGPDESRHRLQLKTLLFGMGETFRTLLQKKQETEKK
jgi:SAM-dependent MidA family methyltransferase